MAEYPLLRKKRRRRSRVRLPALSVRGRTIAIGVLAALAVLAGVAHLLRSEPPNPARLLADALATLEAGNYNAARANAQAAVNAAPGSAAAHVVLARAYLALGNGVAAEGALARAREAGVPAARLHQFQADARLLQGDTDGALDEAGKAMARYAGYATRVRARALAAEGNGVEGQQVIEQLLVEAPRDAEAWGDLARLRYDAGNVGGAADAASRAVALDRRKPDLLTMQAIVVRTRYGLKAALSWFEAALARDAYHYPALLDYAATLGDLGRNADMLSAARRAMAARPGAAQPLYLQAVLAARAGRIGLAEQLMQATGGAVDGLAGAKLLRGALDYAHGRYEQAAARWGELVVAQPMNIAARRLLASARLRSGDSAGALDTLRPMALRADADSYTLVLAARAFEMQGDRAMAASLIDRAGSTGRSPATIFATDRAVGALAAGVAGAPGDPTYAVGLIRGMIEAGNVSGALAEARSLAAAGPSAPAAQIALGDTLMANGQIAGAASAYTRGADLAFDEPTMLRLVDSLGRTGRQKDAATVLALYVGQNPQGIEGQRILGHWQVGAGQWDAAIETLEGVRRAIGTGDAAVLTDLARAYAGDGEGAIAVSYGRAAAGHAPMNAAAADAYGWALFVAGNRDGARQLLDKAVKLAPDDRMIAAHRQLLGG